MIISEQPDRWVILQLPNNEYKVFGTYAGGYLGGDSWRINSGIEKVEIIDDYYLFYGYSGSIYKCHKLGYGTMTSYGAEILKKILDSSDEVALMEDRDNWETLK